MDEYIVLDFETTSNKSSIAKIIQIGALHIVNGEVLETFETYVNPHMNIPVDATGINGITDDMVKDSPSIEDVLPDFIRFIKGKLIVGCNIGTFDLYVLNNQLSDEHFECDYIDIRYLNHTDNGALAKMCELLSVVNQCAHNALYDCYATNEVFLKALDNGADYEIKHFPKDKTQNEKKSRKKQFTDNTKDTRMLIGLITGISCDNVVSDEETRFLKSWIDNNTHLTGVPEYDRISVKLEKILEDGIIDESEKSELLTLLKTIIDPRKENEDSNCNSFEDAIVGELVFDEKVFCLSGDFDYGTKDSVKELIELNRGIITKSISKKCDYLVMGNKGSDEYAFGKYGKKYQKADEINNDVNNNKHIYIISETKLFLEINKR